MTRTESRLFPLPVVLLAVVLIGLPWANGGRSPAGQAALVLILAAAGAMALLTGRPAWPPRPTPLFLVGVLLIIARLPHPLDRTIQIILLSAYVVAGTACGVSETIHGRSGPAGHLPNFGVVVVGFGIVWYVRGSESGAYATVLVGPFGYPNAMAGFLLLASGAAVASLPGDRSRLERAAAVVGCALFPVGLYLTRSRGAVLAACVGVLIWALLERERWWARRWLWGGTAALFVAGGLYLMGHRLVGLLWFVWPGGATEGGDTSVQWRLSILKWTWAMIRDHLAVRPELPDALTHHQRSPNERREPAQPLPGDRAEYGWLLRLAGLALVCLVRAVMAHAARTRQMVLVAAGGICSPNGGPGLELPSHRAHERGPAWSDRRRESASLDRTAAPPDVPNPDRRRVAVAGSRGRCRGRPLQFRRAGDAGARRVGWGGASD
jgi:hypothetical protein